MLSLSKALLIHNSYLVPFNGTGGIISINFSDFLVVDKMMPAAAQTPTGQKH
jgi:hypothetical protein